MEDAHTLITVRSNCLERITSHLHAALLWVATARLEQSVLASPACPPYGSSRRKTCRDLPEDVGQDQCLYPPIIIWYVMKHCGNALPSSFSQILASNIQRLKEQYSGTMDLNKSDHPTKVSLRFLRPKFCILDCLISSSCQNIVPRSVEQCFSLKFLSAKAILTRECHPSSLY